jgi:large subunit ribosomal protein L9
MKVLLVKDVRKLGHLGDVVDVKPGYARNYLMPQRLAIEPTPENVKAIESDRVKAAVERARREKEFAELAEKMADVSITIEAAANDEGTLYGSVSARDIALALQQQGYPILPEHVMLEAPIRSLDKRMVKLEFTDHSTAQVKLWVVRQGSTEHVEQSDESGSEKPEAEPAKG